MIKYQLVCDQNHKFEGWFHGSAAYDEQAANGLLRCPLCDSDQVKRALMTPNLASPKRRKSIAPSAANQLPAAESAASVPEASAPFPPSRAAASHAATSGQAPVTRAEQVQAFGAALAELRQLRQKIIKECRDVGDNFAQEARKIHYGQAEAEGIYGQATTEERELLKDEGIEIFDMPWVPPDH
uniref:Uncharacterized protein conserved in bacteria n=1 Tax=uncultured alpha proteobacterium HF0070_05I22 TaxID=710803 RepID=E0XX69_9PROT|nr:uncharacterized protein conserved in bacteria [uncultured alpha proteobacterium HF0070_05I22]